MPIVLKPLELRVLGVLIEKALSQPAYYPMTLNAVTLGCNQKTNREPVMYCAEGEVAAALHQLQQWQLASHAETSSGARANRFRHEIDKRFGWNSAKKALMAELMLRGPQTVGELRTHAGRMTNLDSMEYARQMLDELNREDPPKVLELPRQPGKNTTRFAHLLGEDADQLREAAANPMAFLAAPPAAAPAAGNLGELESRVAALEEQVEALRRNLARLAGATADQGGGESGMERPAGS